MVHPQETSSDCTLCQYLTESPSTKELLDNLQDPTQLSYRLRELSPTKRSACIVGLILRATKVPSDAGLLTSLPETQVLDIMEEARELVEGASGCISCMTDPEERTHLLRRLLIKLSRNTKMVPRSFLIRGVRLQDSHPVRVGGFADIFQASYKGQLIALKRLRFSRNSPISESAENEFRREAFVSWFLNHPNILPFLGIDQTTFYPLLCIVSAWQQNGNILDWLNYLKNLGLPVLVDEYIRRILSGVDYLHKNGITHGDLSSKNILIDDHCNPKLADLGLSTLHGAGASTMGTHSGGGTLRFMAPEILLEESIQTPFGADIYAFACVCIELHTLQCPFPTIKSDLHVVSAVVQGSRPSKPSEPTNSRDGFWEALSQCWNRNPLTRPSIPSLVASLPLRRPALPMPDQATIAHVNWELPTPQSPHSPASDSSSLWHHLHQDPTFTLDSCLIGFLDFNTADAKNVHEMIERLAALGCPEEITRLVQEGLVGEETAVTGSHSHTEPSVATPEGKQVDVYPPIAAGLDLGESAPVQGAIEGIAEHAASLVSLGLRMRDLRRYKEGSECFLQAVKIQRELATAMPDEFRPLLASSLHEASYCLERLWEYKDAEKYCLEAVGILRHLAQEKPDEFNASLAESLHHLAYVSSHLDKWKDAVVYGRQAVDLRQDLAREKPGEFNAPLSHTLHDLAVCLSNIGEYRDAVVCGRQGVDLRQDLARENPDEFNALLAFSLAHLARYLQILGQHKDVVKYGREAAAIFRSIPQDQPQPGWFQAGLVDNLELLAPSLVVLGFVDEAVQVDQEAEKQKKVRRGVSQ